MSPLVQPAFVYSFWSVQPYSVNLNSEALLLPTIIKFRGVSNQVVWGAEEISKNSWGPIILSLNGQEAYKRGIILAFFE